MFAKNFAARLARASAVVGTVACLISSAWAIGGVAINGIYQDQVNVSSNKKDIELRFKLLGDPLLINTVTCQIMSAGTPPFEVSLSQTNTKGVLVFLPTTFIGQTGSKNVYTVNVTNLGYGVSKNFRPIILARWVNTGNYDVICSILGK